MKGGVVALAAAVAAAGCGAPADRGTRGGVVEVLAASSLTEAFGDLGRRFERSHPGRRVRLRFAASSALAAQIGAGAPADVVATADRASMDALVAAGHARRPVVAARNRLVIAVAPGNPHRLAGLADLARPGLTVVACAPAVPCGRLATAALARAGVTLRPASAEANVKAVLSRVVLGEADAGLVYRTDVVGAGAAVSEVGLGIADHPDLHPPCPVAVTTAAADGRGGRAFVAFVRSPAGRAVLADHGFEPG